mgnify:CR=1 FL=1
MSLPRSTWIAPTLLACLTLSACGGGSSGNSSDAAAATVSYTLGGSVSGLTSSGLILSNGSQTTSVAANATTFSLGSTTGSYDVTIASQPDGQTCAVSQGSGTSSTAVQSVQVTCRGYVAYVANTNSSTIAQFTLGSGTGLLTAQSTATVSVGHQPSALAITSDGAALYAACDDDRAMNTYSVGSTGLLTLLGSVNGTTAGYSLALHPSLQVLYAADFGGGTVSQYTLGSDRLPTAMSLRSVTAGLNPRAVAITPNGQYAYVINDAGDSITQYQVGSTGALTALSTATVPLTANDSPKAIVIDSSSTHAYVVLGGSNKIAQFFIGSTGALVAMSPASVSTGTSPAGIAISPNGVYAYVTNQGDDTVGQYQIASGRLTAMATATVATGDAPHSVAVSPDGRYAYVTNSADATVSQYAIGSGGSLQALSTATIGSGGMKPTAIVVR